MRNVVPFLSFPSEIRNRIFALLFEHDEPLHIVEAHNRTGKAVLHYRAIGRDAALDIENSGLRFLLGIQDSDKGRPELLGELKGTSEPLYTAMFFVCRQIYDEASSVLYKHNTFVFTRFYANYLTQTDCQGNHLTAAAVPWLLSLGSRAPLLQKLHLNSGHMCPDRCATQLDVSYFDDNFFRNSGTIHRFWTAVMYIMAASYKA